MVELSTVLFDENMDVALACLDHPFIRGLKTGSLKLETFQGYLSQDSFYLKAYAKAFAFGISKSQDDETMEVFVSLLNGVFEELKLHGAYSKKWGFPLNCYPSKATSNYVDFLLRVAATEGIGDIAAATLPCDALYLFLGTELKRGDHSRSRYMEWIDTYSSESFRILTNTLAELVNRHGTNHERARCHYRRAMQLEYDFFDEAYHSYIAEETQKGETNN
ncbi:MULTISPECIES: TenA family protein [Dethiosulfovibrio]|uniref:TenA family protein n=2 Tax=Dethiosulfovibrio TaxID=47054 RepID=A0ABS9ELI4_9BACT|nr:MULTISPECIES: TenA family protein [Dethiosulfovibrio]MCF4112907.1 TenA family protein [Dethiosulfovibrio russensis]MCF4141371.1 TenA family protein [Dethiosulfovibrio marinus]MCF4144326.1 TenA family protein [Dethiosulfovibrio acidaminovorans]